MTQTEFVLDVSASEWIKNLSSNNKRRPICGLLIGQSSIECDTTNSSFAVAFLAIQSAATSVTTANRKHERRDGAAMLLESLLISESDCFDDQVKNIIRMLPGGAEIIGVFLAGGTEELLCEQSATTHYLIKIIKKIEKQTHELRVAKFSPANSPENASKTYSSTRKFALVWNNSQKRFIARKFILESAPPHHLQDIDLCVRDALHEFHCISSTLTVSLQANLPCCSKKESIFQQLLSSATPFIQDFSANSKLYVNENLLDAQERLFQSPSSSNKSSPFLLRVTPPRTPPTPHSANLLTQQNSNVAQLANRKSSECVESSSSLASTYFFGRQKRLSLSTNSLSSSQTPSVSGSIASTSSSSSIVTAAATSSLCSSLSNIAQFAALNTHNNSNKKTMRHSRGLPISLIFAGHQIPKYHWNSSEYDAMQNESIDDDRINNNAVDDVIVDRTNDDDVDDDDVIKVSSSPPLLLEDFSTLIRRHRRQKRPSGNRIQIGGRIPAIAFVHLKISVMRAAQLMKEDLVRSLVRRLELLAEEFSISSAKMAECESHLVFPQRVRVTLPFCAAFPLFDHKFLSETSDDVITRVQFFCGKRGVAGDNFDDVIGNNTRRWRGGDRKHGFLNEEEHETHENKSRYRVSHCDLDSGLDDDNVSSCLTGNTPRTAADFTEPISCSNSLDDELSENECFEDRALHHHHHNHHHHHCAITLANQRRASWLSIKLEWQCCIIYCIIR